MNIDELIYWLNIIGTIAFAISGSLLAGRKNMDIVGFIFIATVTGVGGGTLRDVILDQPVFWVVDPSILYVCALSAIFTFWVTLNSKILMSTLIWFDAMGLALFTIIGTQKAISVGAPYSVAALMGIMSASFGGIMRDVICNEIPVLLQKEIYITASLIGAIAFAIGHYLFGDNTWVTIFAFLICFGVRSLAIIFGLSFPERATHKRPLQ
ncbi:MAG: trimeric intracellular cation channel family protein [Candidatus Pelagadaptatus aseana]|uniref:trimeric intracellular cation channel family protein n=1 Tax=Candidatus Pelagadaptatus aseana TaxID=3120508 RepID=UPI0039B1B4B5